MLVQFGCVHDIKDIISWLLTLCKLFQQPVNCGLNLDCVQVAHRILTQEVKGDLVIALKTNMLATQRAATNSVSFIFSFFVANTKRQLVDQVGADADLVVDSVVRVHLLVVVLTNSLNGILESSGFLVLKHVATALHARLCRKLYILTHQETGPLVSERGQPSAVLLLNHAFPAVAWHIADRDWRVLPDVDRHELRDDPLFQLSSMRVLSTAPEDSRRFHGRIAGLLELPIK